MKQVNCPVCKDELTEKEVVGYWCLTCKKSLNRIEEELLDYINAHNVCKLCGETPEYRFEEVYTFNSPKFEVTKIYCKNCDYPL